MDLKTVDATRWALPWGTLVCLTFLLDVTDPRVQPVMRLMAVCNDAFGRDDLEEFQKGLDAIRVLIHGDSEVMR
ncbi:MAG: hypothetical protein KGJ82_11225 [Nitrospirota bacterium]|nr:hypothetical protein [Nitrospirota bacterium]